MTTKPKLPRRRQGGWSSKQRWVWRHNMALGHVAMIRQLARYLKDLPSADLLARDDARAIFDLAYRLDLQLRKVRLPYHD